MELNKFDQYFNIADGQGKQFHQLPYDVRVALFTGLDKEQYTQFSLGRASDETLKQAQSIYDNWWNESNPTDQDLYEAKLQRQAENRIWNLNRQLKLAKQELAKLDEMYKKDMILPVGKREQLRKEIAQLERDLQISKPIIETEASDDWSDSFFTE